MIKLNLKPELRILHQFAWVAAVAFPLLAAFFTRGDARWYAVGAWTWTHPVVLALGGIGLVQLLACLVGFRQLTVALYVVMTLVAFPIGFVISHVLMAVIYYLVITPIALVFRLMGRDVIGKRIDPAKPTYWHDRGPVRPAPSYFKLY